MCIRDRYYKGNKEITWETSHSFNTGFDIAFWGGKLGGSVEYLSLIHISGVQTTSNNGQPGKDAEVRIRGIGSISASNKPLYVVDGVPYDGEISAISTSDIESMTVLKDAASNALYGARAVSYTHLDVYKRQV